MSVFVYWFIGVLIFYKVSFQVADFIDQISISASILMSVIFVITIYNTSKIYTINLFNCLNKHYKNLTYALLKATIKCFVISSILYLVVSILIIYAFSNDFFVSVFSSSFYPNNDTLISLIVLIPLIIHYLTILSGVFITNKLNKSQHSDFDENINIEKNKKEHQSTDDSISNPAIQHSRKASRWWYCYHAIFALLLKTLIFDLWLVSLLPNNSQGAQIKVVAVGIIVIIGYYISYQIIKTVEYVFISVKTKLFFKVAFPAMCFIIISFVQYKASQTKIKYENDIISNNILKYYDRESKLLQTIKNIEIHKDKSIFKGPVEIKGNQIIYHFFLSKDKAKEFSTNKAKSEYMLRSYLFQKLCSNNDLKEFFDKFNGSLMFSYYGNDKVEILSTKINGLACF